MHEGPTSPWPELARRPSLHRSSARQRSALRYSMRSFQALFYHFFLLKTNKRRARGQWPAKQNVDAQHDLPTQFRPTWQYPARILPDLCKPGSKSRCSSKVLRLCPFHCNSRNFHEAAWKRRGRSCPSIVHTLTQQGTQAQAQAVRRARCHGMEVAVSPFTIQGIAQLDENMYNSYHIMSRDEVSVECNPPPSDYCTDPNPAGQFCCARLELPLRM